MPNVGTPALLAVAVFLVVAVVLSIVIKNRKRGEPVDGAYDGGLHSNGSDTGIGCDAGGADGGCGGDGGSGE